MSTRIITVLRLQLFTNPIERRSGRIAATLKSKSSNKDPIGLHCSDCVYLCSGAFFKSDAWHVHLGKTYKWFA